MGGERVIVQTDGNVRAVYNMGLMDHAIIEETVPANDNKYHIVRFTRNGANSSLQLDNIISRTRLPTGEINFTCRLIARCIVFYII
jgi:Laminin G domain